MKYIGGTLILNNIIWFIAIIILQSQLPNTDTFNSLFVTFWAITMLISYGIGVIINAKEKQQE